MVDVCAQILCLLIIFSLPMTQHMDDSARGITMIRQKQLNELTEM